MLFSSQHMMQKNYEYMPEDKQPLQNWPVIMWLVETILLLDCPLTHETELIVIRKHVATMQQNCSV